MAHTGAMLPVALAVLSGCSLTRGLAVQKFGFEKAELDAERAETRVRMDSAGSLEMLEHAEHAGERAQTRVRTDSAGSLEMTSEVKPTMAGAERGSTQPWNGDPVVTSPSPASLLQTVEGKAAVDRSTANSLADMKKSLEAKIIAITAQEDKRKEAIAKASEEVEHALAAVSSPEMSLKDIRKKLEDSIAAIPQLPEIPEVEGRRKILQRKLDDVVKKQLEETLSVLPQIPDQYVEPARLALQSQLNDLNARINSVLVSTGPADQI